MKDINKIIDSLSPGEQNVMYNALRVKLDKKPEYTISKDEHGYYVSSDKRMFGTFRFEKKEYAELAYQIWKNMKPDEHLMYTVRGVFRILNIDRITNSIEVECHSFDGLNVFPEVWSLDSTEAGFEIGDYKLVK